MYDVGRYLAGLFELSTRTYRPDPAALARVRDQPYSIGLTAGVALHLWHLYGTKDFLQASGKLMFAGRWPIAKASPWNEALRGQDRPGSVPHQRQAALLRLRVQAPVGRRYAGTVIDTIEGILEPQR